MRVCVGEADQGRPSQVYVAFSSIWFIQVIVIEAAASGQNDTPFIIKDDAFFTQCSLQDYLHHIVSPFGLFSVIL